MNRLKINRAVFLVLAGLVAVDLLIVATDLIREGGVDLLTLGSAVALIALCASVWFGVSWGRWLLLGFIAWRIFLLGKVAASSFDPGEVLRFGALAVLLFYVVSAAVLVSWIVRTGRRGTT